MALKDRISFFQAIFIKTKIRASRSLIRPWVRYHMVREMMNLRFLFNLSSSATVLYLEQCPY